MMRSTVPFLFAVLIALTGCAQAQYRNTLHPDYGAAQLGKDRDECERQNSHEVTSQGNYSETSHVAVDQEEAQACLAARGWRASQN